MKTEEEIRERLVYYQRYLKQVPDNLEITAWANSLDWVLEEDPPMTEEEFWNRLVQLARENPDPPKTIEEIRRDIEELLQRPVPFFKYLKEKTDAR